MRYARVSRTLLLLLVGGCLATVHVEAQDAWTEAESRIARLAPSRFVDVPEAVRAELERLGCRIPQSWGGDEPHNVISGSFAAAGQTDWAALCSVRDASSVVVVWGGEHRCPSPVSAPAPDAAYLQDTGVDGILFSRGISAVRPKPGYWSFPSDLAPQSVEHDAVSDAFFEKGATAYYCRDGRWLRVTSD